MKVTVILWYVCFGFGMVNGMMTKDNVQPGYSLKYSEFGKLIQGLKCYDLIVGINLPEQWHNLKKVGDLLPSSFEEFCDQIYNESLAHEICKEIILVTDDYKYHETIYQEWIEKQLEYDLVLILPDLDQCNNINKAKLRINEFKFDIKSRKPYEWEHQNKIKVDMPQRPKTVEQI